MSDIRILKCHGIWDTGATNSVITQKVVDNLGLQPTGKAEVHGVHGKAEADTFLVNVFLPNNVGIQAVTVTKAFVTGADVLVGMDIIGFGDFCVTNVGGMTALTFRTPSGRDIDFVKEIEVEKLPRSERRDLARQQVKKLRTVNTR